MFNAKKFKSVACMKEHANDSRQLVLYIDGNVIENVNNSHILDTLYILMGTIRLIS